MQKLYCYVDETGQDTKGALFSVCCTIVVSEQQRERLEQRLHEIEHVSRKKSKWQKTDNQVKRSFLEALVEQNDALRGNVYIQHFYQIHDFTQATTEAIVRSINASHHQELSTLIYIDGLPQTLVPRVAVILRRHGIKTEKIKGLKDEQSILIRLSDAIAGFVRDYLEGQDYTKTYFLKLVASGVITEI